MESISSVFLLELRYVFRPSVNTGEDTRDFVLDIFARYS